MTRTRWERKSPTLLGCPTSRRVWASVRGCPTVSLWTSTSASTRTSVGRTTEPQTSRTTASSASKELISISSLAAALRVSNANIHKWHYSCSERSLMQFKTLKRGFLFKNNTNVKIVKTVENSVIIHCVDLGQSRPIYRSVLLTWSFVFVLSIYIHGSSIHKKPSNAPYNTLCKWIKHLVTFYTQVK